MELKNKLQMKSDNPVIQIVSLLMLFGPIVLFWYIDWYWIVGYYNLFFTYTCYLLYRQYDSDSNYRRKYHFIVYVGLPLIENPNLRPATGFGQVGIVTVVT